MTTMTYFSVTTIISAHVISDSMPRTSSGVAFNPVKSLKQVWTV